MLSVKKDHFNKYITNLSEENFQKAATENNIDPYAKYVDKLSYLSALLRANYEELFKNQNFSDDEKLKFMQDVKKLNNLFFQFKTSNYDESKLEEILRILKDVLKKVRNAPSFEDEFSKIEQKLIKLSNIQSKDFCKQNEPRIEAQKIQVDKSIKKFFIWFFLLFILIFNILVIMNYEFILSLIY